MAELNVHSDIAASIWQVLVEPDSQVGEGDEVMILESMKMEVPVTAPRAGRVLQVLVVAGQSVEEGELLIRLDIS
ncbi:MAG TPA: acetyl-CoA carboxylase biotin carboxyl carrier protein subunit [Jatrophihabitans sp.]|nr:acetyl-CoA carboxylase biotin carboxyl carrier protein subunit [Jatrophihabitans sp.]